MASFLRSINANYHDTFKLLIFRGVCYLLEHIKQLVLYIGGAFFTIKECIAMLSKFNYYQQNYVLSRHLHIQSHQNQ